MIETKYLKDNIQNIQKLLSIPALKNFETRNLGKLLKLSKIREYEDGEIIITEGDVDPWLYFLLSGKIKVVKEGVQINIINGHKESLNKSDNAGSEGFDYYCNWEVKGTVEHWGHIHMRTNQYEALFSIHVIENSWKITRLQVLNQKTGKIESIQR